MFDRIAPRYDFVNRVMTLGMDMSWRRAAVRALGLEPGSLVLDVACGTGDFCRILRELEMRAIGFDYAWEMIAHARAHVPLVQADALALPVRAGVADGVTCGFALRNVVDLAALFAEMARATRPGGRIAVLEVAEPESGILRAGHHLYFRWLVPLIGGVLSDRPAYRYLPRSTAYLPGRSELVRTIESGGFDDVEITSMSLGAVQIITATKRR